MEAPLRCNNIRSCRVTLTEQAVVTTCSHIFCLNCSHKSGLSRSKEADRKCPACGTQLSNRDDAVTTILQPTEDYKTSVLSGLDPTTIMECAGRGLAFWAYQSTQEILYNEAMGKNLAEKYNHLSSQLDKTIDDANSEIQSLQNKIQSLQIDQKTLQQKNVELIEMYRDKSKKQAQTQHLYNTLKKRVMASQVQSAASESVAQATNSNAGIARPQTFGDATYQPLQTKTPRPFDHQAADPNHQQPHNSRSPSHSSRDARFGNGTSAMPPPQGLREGHQPYGIASTTPQHRTHLPGMVRTAAARSQIPLSTRAPGTGPRQSLGVNTTNTRANHTGSSGHGITAGMKIGRPPRPDLSHGEQIADRSNAHINIDNPRFDPFGDDRAFSRANLY